MASSRSTDRSISADAGPRDGRGREPVKGRQRVVIERVRPQVDGGRYPAKGSRGEPVAVAATVYGDGHDQVGAEVRYRAVGDRGWTTVVLDPVGNDRWEGVFPVTRLGTYHFQVRGDIDQWGTWRRDLLVRADALQEVDVDLQIGAELCQAAAARARGEDRKLLAAVAAQLRLALRGLESDVDVPIALDHGGTVAGLVVHPGLADLMWTYRPPEQTVSSPRLEVMVEPELARFSTWYELFPRSTVDQGGHGTLTDVIGRLDYVSRLGADVLYLPPIHPIGVTNRKGRNGEAAAGPDDPGSPWAIGGAAGGHTAVHPDLGTLDDVDRLVAAAAARGIAIALDLAFQCSPDHPWVTEHPDWFRHLPDGSIRFAENPPKRYEDIYPLDFETEDWQGLWEALAAVVRFWVDRGIQVFRVDNPHTKPFAFWEWLLRSIKADHPEVIFLAEAFARPAVLQRLAAIGFSQSYTYFTWRSSAWELRTYLEELTRTEQADYLRPNFWPNTPDILPVPLQTGGTPAFLARLVLAATLSANYGIYGPPFELTEHRSRQPGSEEYLDSEKYQLRRWDLGRPDSLADFVARVNRIRHEHPALQHNRTLRFHGSDNEQLLAYSKTLLVESPYDLGEPPAHDPRDPDVILVVVSLDSQRTQSGWIDLDLVRLGLGPDDVFTVHDLLTDAHFEWRGSRNFVQLDPEVVPAHVFRVRRPRPADGTERR
jgi:starch synthase (maltosyl-transferring)